MKFKPSMEIDWSDVNENLWIACSGLLSITSNMLTAEEIWGGQKVCNPWLSYLPCLSTCPAAICMPSCVGFTKAKKGLTLEEVEEQEGGVVKESKLGMAKTKRAQRRKQEAPQDGTHLSL